MTRLLGLTLGACFLAGLLAGISLTAWQGRAITRALQDELDELARLDCSPPQIRPTFQLDVASQVQER